MPAIEASDLFGLGANFHPQSSSSSNALEAATANASDGDVACETMKNGVTTYTTDYKYCGTDIKTDLGAFLTAFGGVSSGKLITELSVDFAAGDQPTVRVSGETADDNPAAALGTNTADVSAAFPATAGGVTVPTLAGVTLGTDASPTSLSLTARMNKVSATGADGNHFFSQLITPIVEGSASYVGVPTSYDAPTGWTTDSTEESDSNSDFDQASWTGHRNFNIV